MFDFRCPGVICTFLSCAMAKPLKALTIHQPSDTSAMGTWWMLLTHWQMKKIEFLWFCTKLTLYYYPWIFFSAIKIVVKIKIGTTSCFQREFEVFFLALACTPMIFSVPINVWIANNTIDSIQLTSAAIKSLSEQKEEMLIYNGLYPILQLLLDERHATPSFRCYSSRPLHKNQNLQFFIVHLTKFFFQWNIIIGFLEDEDKAAAWKLPSPRLFSPQVATVPRKPRRV